MKLVRSRAGDHRLSWLNMALNYWNLGEIAKAENALIFAQALADRKGDQTIRNQADISLEIIRLYQEAKLKRNVIDD